MTAETLKTKSMKDLTEMAKKRGIAGWHAMRKEDLVKALLRMARKTANGHAANGHAAHNGHAPNAAAGAAAVRRAPTPAANGSRPPAKSPIVAKDAKDKKLSLAA